jgi:hypothetical protein
MERHRGRIAEYDERKHREPDADQLWHSCGTPAGSSRHVRAVEPPDL